MLRKVNIKSYRELAGLSQDSLGVVAGVTRQTIASWENGSTQPTFAELAKVANALHVPIELLLGEESGLEVGLLFRADDPAALTPELRALLSRKAADYAELEEILGESSAVPMSRPLDGYDEYIVQQTAAEVRNWLGLGDTGAVSNLFSLLENRGLKIIRHKLPETIFGFSAYTENHGALIVLNSEQSPERQLSTALHELGHLIFHRREYIAANAAPPKKGKDQRERSANALAGAIMLPDKVVIMELHRYRHEWIPIPVLADIKERYWVSMQMVVTRAGQVGILTEAQAGKQFGWLKKKYGINEPYKLSDLPGLSRLKKLTYTALLNGEITSTRASEILDLPLREVKKELSEWALQEAH